LTLGLTGGWRSPTSVGGSGWGLLGVPASVEARQGLGDGLSALQARLAVTPVWAGTGGVRAALEASLRWCVGAEYRGLGRSRVGLAWVASAGWRGAWGVSEPLPLGAWALVGVGLQ
jgi:hypothetical protein